MDSGDHRQMYINITYPLLLQRYKSTLIDFLLLLVLNIIVLLISQALSNPQVVIIPFVILSFLLYEPLLTVYSCTIGQRLMRIRVRDGHDPFKRITLWQSYARYFVKILLGWLSFITIHQNEQKRAIHDFAGTTVMVHVENLH